MTDHPLTEALILTDPEEITSNILMETGIPQGNIPRPHMFLTDNKQDIRETRISLLGGPQEDRVTGAQTSKYYIKS